MDSPIVTEARRWIGTPYMHQASVLGVGADCLGLLRGVWRVVVGPEPEPVPNYTRDWSEADGREDLFAAALRWLGPCRNDDPFVQGQVLLFRMRDGAVAKHLGILAATGGDAAFIHAYTGHGVIESPLSDPWARRIVGRFSFPLER